jgi:class 3 adenylate cyclase
VNVCRRTLFNGPRVRMGVNVGSPKIVQDPMTRRLEYMGPVINFAAFLTSRSHGGQILLSTAAYEKARETDLGKERKRIIALGTFEMPDSTQGTEKP